MNYIYVEFYFFLFDKKNRVWFIAIYSLVICGYYVRFNLNLKVIYKHVIF